MTEASLESAIFGQILKYRSMVPAQISVNLKFPDERDEEIFAALENLERKGLIHHKPASSEVPNANDADPYMGKIYRLGDGKPLFQPITEAYKKVIEKVRQYF